MKDTQCFVEPCHGDGWRRRVEATGLHYGLQTLGRDRQQASGPCLYASVSVFLSLIHFLLSLSRSLSLSLSLSLFAVFAYVFSVSNRPDDNHAHLAVGGLVGIADAGDLQRALL
jgi:hypothetical protein